MSILILNFFIISFILLIASNSKKKDSVFKWLLPVIFIQLLYLKSFVDINTVPDLDGYRDHFLEVRYLSVVEIFKVKAEFGFYLLAKLCYSISHSYRFFLLVYNAIMLSLVYVWIKRQSVNVALSVVFFLLMAYNGSIYVLRQYMAIAILLLSHRYIIDRKLIKFVILIIIAMSFHRTAIIFFPMYFIYNVKNLWTAGIVIGVIGAGVYWATQNPYFFIADLNGNENYMKYLDQSQYSTTITTALICFSFLMAYILIIKKKILQDGVDRMFFYMLLIATIVCFLGAGLPLVGRLVRYYDIVLILIIPYIAKHIKNAPFRYAFIMIVFLLEFYIAFLSSSADDYVYMKVPTVLDF